MKRTVVGAVLVVAVVMFVCSGAAAAMPAMTYGGKFALNFASGTGPDAGDWGADEMKSGFAVGAVVDIEVLGDLILQTGLVYTQKGGEGNYLWSGLDSTYTLEYIEVPVLAKYPLSGGAAYVWGGLTLGFLSKAEIDMEGFDSDDISDDISDLDLCISVGASASFRAGPGRVNAGIEYSRGLLTIDDDGDFDVFNQTISVMVTYTF